MIDKLKPKTSKTHVLDCVGLSARFLQRLPSGLPSPQLCGFPTVFQNSRVHPPSTSELVSGSKVLTGISAIAYLSPQLLTGSYAVLPAPFRGC